MKKINQFTSATMGILAICLVVLSVSCSKKQDPAPATPVTKTSTITSTEHSTMCGDTICNLPYRIASAFMPSGYWNTGETTATFTIDSCGETPAYAGEGMRIVYTNHGGYWGASFLNNNNWAGAFNVNPAATKISFNLRIDYSANITFLAFGRDSCGKKEFYKIGTPLTAPVWEKVTISLLNKPKTFSAPLTVEIDGVVQSGKVTVVDIKDILIE